MRTTVTIDDNLLREAKVAAARTGQSLGQVLDDALRLLLHHGRHDTADVSLPTYGGSGLRPGVDLEDKDALADLLEESEHSRAAG
ncbi:MAG TPA: CopG family transcriptional regulator [Marmoricola sp.]